MIPTTAHKSKKISFKLLLLTAKHPVNSLDSCQELWGKLKTKSHQGKPSQFVCNTERGSGCWWSRTAKAADHRGPTAAWGVASSPPPPFTWILLRQGPSLLRRERQSHRQLLDKPLYPEPIPLRVAWVWKWESKKGAQRIRDWKEDRTNQGRIERLKFRETERVAKQKLMDREGAGESAGHAVAEESIGLWWRAAGQVASSPEMRWLNVICQRRPQAEGFSQDSNDILMDSETNLTTNELKHGLRALIENGTDAQKMAYNVLNAPEVCMLRIMYSMYFFMR